ncbi:protein FMC1 homolog [Octopus sinensis]|uniref:Protein FMC1 homolog n=1 Tax=Octopus sinensis TaxID=2607531 RepID=A0A6P7T9U1_9MOLL|nr:protein FMC1 homolog [Octopus sinensis]
MATNANSLSLLRAIIRELRHVYGKGLYQSPSYLYMKDQFHKSSVTSEKYCRSKTDLQYQAMTYLTFLQSSRLLQEVTDMYKGAGERSIEASAELVGLKLPKNHVPET